MPAAPTVRSIRQYVGLATLHSCRAAGWLKVALLNPLVRRFDPRRLFATFSLRKRLALLSVAAVLPLFGLGLGEACLRYQSEWSGIAERMLELTRATLRTVEADHHAQVAALQAIALSPDLQAGNLEASRPTLQAFIGTQPKGSTLGIADENGQILFLVTTRPENVREGRLPRRRNMAPLQRVFRTGRPAISDLFTGAVAQTTVYTVEVPVFRDGHVAYDLFLSRPPQSLTDLITRQGFEDGRVISIFDSRGAIAAREPPGERFVGGLVSPPLQSALASGSEGTLLGVSLEGIPLISAFSRSTSSGWGVAIGLPVTRATSPLRQRLLILVGICTFLLLVGLALSAAAARSIVGPIRSLARFASAADHEDNPQTRATGLREVDEVGRVLSAARASLQALTNTLEQRVEAEVAQRMRAEEHLRQAQRMEAVGQLTAGIAHDFNNLLQAQMAGLELLLKEVLGMDRARRLVEMAIASGEKGARLTHSLLSFSRQQILQPEAVEVSALLERLRELLSRTLDPRIELRIEMEPRLAPPLADPAQLEAALLNLCLNARDAMTGRPGRLLIEAREAGKPERPDTAHYIVFAVEDEGCGMQPETLGRVCEPFFTTKSVGQGSGLGLSMVQGFARQSEGELRLQSWPDKGTRVEIWLPRAPSAIARVNAALKHEEAVEEQSRHPRLSRVLLVDNDPDVRELLADLLESIGFDVTQVYRGEEALKALRAGVLFEALVTDYAMPGLTGVELVRQAHRLWPGLPALIVTGFAEAAQLGDVPHGVAIMHKPFRANDFAKRVADLVEAGHAATRITTAAPVL